MDTHAFAQLVLPLGGSMEVDVEGHGAWLDRTRAAFVAPTARDGQRGQVHLSDPRKVNLTLFSSNALETSHGRPTG
ncbi:MAG: hypothetical protein AB1832_02605 [Pseudomonadota bacterium]